MARSKLKSMSHHDIAHLHPQPMSLPSVNFVHLTVAEKLPGHFKVKVTVARSLWQGQRLNQGHTMTLHPYTP